MTYQTGTVNNMNDLMTTLSTFAVASSWVEDQYTAESGATDGKLSLHDAGTNIYVHFAWNSSQSPSIGVYHSLGFISAGTNLWQHTNDSGGGVAAAPNTGANWNSTSINSRFIQNIGSGPYTSYHFFTGGSEEYIHIALEYAPFIYRHFGFGEIEKAWDFTGGEYCYGNVQSVAEPSSQEHLLHSVGSSSFPARSATMHVEGLDGQSGSSKWGTCGLVIPTTSNWDDRDGNERVRLKGGAPGGVIGSVFNNLPSNAGDGFLPLSANAIFYQNLSPTPNELFFMGFQPDVRTLNMKAFSPKDEITIGADIWKIFPAVRKQNTGDINESENLGIAYKKIP